MYRAKISTTDMVIWDDIHIHGDPDICIIDGTITQSATDIDSFAFYIYPNNPHYEVFADASFRVFVSVEDAETGQSEFIGRVISSVPTMDDDGLLYYDVMCESLEALLKDQSVDTTGILQAGVTIDPADRGIKEDPWTITPMPDGTFRVRSRWYFEELIKLYNDQAPIYGQIKIGNYRGVFGSGFNAETRDGFDICVKATYGTVVHDLLNELITLDSLMNVDGIDDRVRPAKGSLYLHPADDGGLILDVAEYGIESSSVGGLNVGENIGNISREPDYTGIVTSVTPMGEEITEKHSYTADDGEEIEYTTGYRWGLDEYRKVLEAEKPGYFSSRLRLFGLQLKGSDQISNPAAIEKYGYISRPLVLSGLFDQRTVTNDDGSESSEKYISLEAAMMFLDKVIAYLVNHGRPVISISMTAYDLSYINEDFSRFRLYDEWWIRHKYLSISEVMPIVRRVIYMDEPQKSTVEFGNKAPRESTDKVYRQKKTEKEAAESGNAETDSLSHTGQDNYAYVAAGSSGDGGESTGGGCNCPADKGDVGYYPFHALMYDMTYTAAEQRALIIPPRSKIDISWTFMEAGLYERCTTDIAPYPSSVIRKSFDSMVCDVLYEAGYCATKSITANYSGVNLDNLAWFDPASRITIDEITPIDLWGVTHRPIITNWQTHKMYQLIGSTVVDGVRIYLGLPRINVSFSLVNPYNSELKISDTAGWMPNLHIRGHFTVPGVAVASSPDGNNPMRQWAQHYGTPYDNMWQSGKPGYSRRFREFTNLFAITSYGANYLDSDGSASGTTNTFIRNEPWDS